jgi:thiamine monophosphate synthase
MSLKDCVRSWANGNIEDTADWLNELIKHKIRDIQALEKLAKSYAWEDFLRLISPLLRANLQFLINKVGVQFFDFY